MVSEKTNYVGKENYADNFKAEAAGYVLTGCGVAAACTGIYLAYDVFQKYKAGVPHSEWCAEETASLVLAIGGTNVATAGALYLGVELEPKTNGIRQKSH